MVRKALFLRIENMAHVFLIEKLYRLFEFHD